jgi:hypothetical protein
LEFAEETEDGGGVAVGQGADDAQGVGQGSTSGGGGAFEDLAEGFDLVRGPVGDIGGVRDLTLPAERKDSRRRKAGGELRLGTMATYMPTL